MKSTLSGYTKGPWFVLSLLVLASLCVFLLSNKTRESRGADLFRKVHPSNRRNLPLDKRMKYAKRIAENHDYEKWLVVLLYDKNGIKDKLKYLDDVADDLGRRAVEEMKADRVQGENGVIAALLLNTPDDASDAVLLAVTTELDNEGQGDYARRTLLIRSHGLTEPIKEIAYDTLKRCVGADHGYDEALWRKEILCE